MQWTLSNVFSEEDERRRSFDFEIEMYTIFMFISIMHVTSFKCARLVNQNTYLQKLYSDRIFKYAYHEHFLKYKWFLIMIKKE